MFEKAKKKGEKINEVDVKKERISYSNGYKTSKMTMTNFLAKIK